MKRVGVLHGGHPHILDITKRVPPSQRLKIARYQELGSSNFSGSTTAWSDGEDDDIVPKLKARKLMD